MSLYLHRVKEMQTHHVKLQIKVITFALILWSSNTHDSLDDGIHAQTHNFVGIWTPSNRELSNGHTNLTTV